MTKFRLSTKREFEKLLKLDFKYLNGSAIFKAGDYLESTSGVVHGKLCGYYWSSTDEGTYPYQLFFLHCLMTTCCNYNFLGMNVRLVSR